MGSLPRRLACRRAHDGDLVSGRLRGIHQGQRRRLGARRAHSAFPRRLGDRGVRPSRHRANQDDDFAARAGRGRDLRRALHRPLLRLLREARRPLGPGAAPADLRKGPARSGRSVGQAFARSGRAQELSRRLSPPCLSAAQDRLQGEDRHARYRGAGARRAYTPAARAGFPAVRCDYPPPRSGGGGRMRSMVEGVGLL